MQFGLMAPAARKVRLVFVTNLSKAVFKATRLEYFI